MWNHVIFNRVVATNCSSKLGQRLVKEAIGRTLCTGVKGEVYDRKPVKVELKAGKVYSWCACGRSKNQPFCDGSHNLDQATGEKLSKPPIKSIKYTSGADKSVLFCNCKQSRNPPLCDGTHKKLRMHS